MTSLVERPHLLRPDIELDFHIKDIVKVLFYENLRDMILVGHTATAGWSSPQELARIGHGPR
jgi:hypothetical protein